MINLTTCRWMQAGPNNKILCNRLRIAKKKSKNYLCDINLLYPEECKYYNPSNTVIQPKERRQNNGDRYLI